MENNELPYEFQKKHAMRLSDKDGNFISQYPGEVGKGFSVGYLEEMCEWVFFKDDISTEEKEERILGLEYIIEQILANPKSVNGPIKYNPTWSKRFKKDE